MDIPPRSSTDRFSPYLLLALSSSAPPFRPPFLLSFLSSTSLPPSVHPSALPSMPQHLRTMPGTAIPTATSLDEVYTAESLVHQGERWNGLFDAFQKEYGTAAQKVSRAPGRVNIIGALPSLLPLFLGVLADSFLP